MGRGVTVGQRAGDGLGLLGRELELGMTAADLLGVQARLISVVDRRQDDPGPEESSSAIDIDWRPDISP